MRRRPAFTLVEMLVSVALVLLVMVLLAQAFGTALQVFSGLKGVGDMEDKLRTAATVLRRDLSANHFDGNRKLSELKLNDPVNGGPPPQGFFRIWQGSPSLPYIDPVTGLPVVPASYEGVDGNNVPSVLTTDRILHFTVQLSGNGRGDFFYTDISSMGSISYTGLANYLLPDYPPDSRYQQSGTPVTYSCQAAEVAYFLRPNGNVTPSATVNGSPTAGKPLYTLYRRQLLTVPNNSQFNGTSTSSYSFQLQIGNPAVPFDYSNLFLPGFAEVSCKANFDASGTQPATPFIYFNNLVDLTIPERRFGMDPNPTAVPDPSYPGQFGYPCFPLCQINAAPGTWTYPTLATDPYAVGYYFPPSAANYPPKTLNYNSLANSEALLEDVISFDVKIYSGGSFIDVPASPNNPMFSSAVSVVNPLGAAGVRVFDTWSNSSDSTATASGDSYTYAAAWNDTNPTATLATQVKRIPLQMTVPAIQITIRLWDKRTQQSRQVSFVQDM